MKTGLFLPPLSRRSGRKNPLDRCHTRRHAGLLLGNLLPYHGLGLGLLERDDWNVITAVGLIFRVRLVGAELLSFCLKMILPSG